MPFDSLLLLAAMDEEERALGDALAAYPSSERFFGRLLKIRAREYRIGGRTVILARSGMGPVNAALALAGIAEHRALDAVILFGVGGSIAPELRIGDVVISRRVLQHDSLSSLESGPVRMAPGALVLGLEDLEGHVAAIEADPTLVELLSGALPAGHFTLGTIVSGNEFVGTLERKQDLRALDPEALLVEMEAAGIAQSARRIGLPFVVVKTVADRLHADGSIEADFLACLGAAARNAAAVLHRLLGA